VHRTDPLLLLAGGLGLAGVIVLAAGSTAWGLVVVFGAVAVVLLRGSVERRAGSRGPDGLRRYAAISGKVVTARGRGELRAFRPRRELADLELERSRLYRELGEAVHGGDEAAAEAAKSALTSLLAAIAAKQEEIEGIVLETREDVMRAQAPPPPQEDP
jgi:hypothetical protein